VSQAKGKSAAGRKRPKATSTKSGAARKKRAATGVSLAGALAEAAWREADEALASALADLDEVETSADEVARAEALVLLSQSLSRAARKRGLARIGALGGRELYDPQRHDLNVVVAKKPKSVHILARGVARGTQVLVKPRVEPVGRKKRP
jgi:hypothetical protein